MLGWPREVRRTLGWLNERRSLRPPIWALRELLPGDSQFGDPLSTTGSDPRRALARQAWTLNESRWSALAELALAVLQVADWVGSDLRSGGHEDEVAILFTDLVGFSTWALRVGDQASLHGLRSIDAVITAVVRDNAGDVIKRLGDGTMAVFPGARDALTAAESAIEIVRRMNLDSYRPQMRAGLHFGTPQQIGTDYIGVDVNVAARLCEAASPNEVMVSDEVQRRLGDAARKLHRRHRRDLDGVPGGLGLYGLAVDGAGSPAATREGVSRCRRSTCAHSAAERYDEQPPETPTTRPSDGRLP